MNALTCLDNNMFLSEQKVCLFPVFLTGADAQFGAGDGYLNCMSQLVASRKVSGKLTTRLPIQLGLCTDRWRSKRNIIKTEFINRSRHALTCCLGSWHDYDYYHLCLDKHAYKQSHQYHQPER